MKTKTLLALLSFSIILFSCKKDPSVDTISSPDHPSIKIPASSPVTGRVTGIVVDENNQPVQNAEVSLAGNIYMTDVKGYFNTNNVVLDKYITTVTVNKNGYFKAYRSFSATASRNYLSIKLIPKTLIATIDANAGGTASLSNGTVITLETNSIVIKGTNTAYSGPVKVYASYIDPTRTDLASIVPGSMMGQDNEHMYVLQSTGMIAVDLESNSGQALQLAAGKPASIKLPIPASLVEKAPSTIDTWSLNEQGVWSKEGTATKNGNFYEVQATHFSFWNCDLPLNAVYLTIHIEDQVNNPLSNTLVALTIPNNTSNLWATSYGTTDSTGTVSGLVPSGQVLNMKLFSNLFQCIAPFITQNVGPFGNDSTINVSINLGNTQVINISGTLLNCNGQPLTNGQIAVESGPYNIYFATVSNGSYTISVPYCTLPSSITVNAADSSGATANSGPVAFSGNTVIVPPITVCNANPDAQFQILSCQAAGTLTVGVPQNASNYIMYVVNVIAPGGYLISHNEPNSYVHFYAAGSLTHTGLDTIYVYGNGSIPILAGTFTLPLYSYGQTCYTTIVVNPVNASYTFMGAPGACESPGITGTYTSGVALDNNNYVDLLVNLTGLGSYNVSTNTINGFSFSGTGDLTNDGGGPGDIRMHGIGTPLSPGVYTFIPTGGQTQGCSFTVTVN